MSAKHDNIRHRASGTAGVSFYIHCGHILPEWPTGIPYRNPIEKVTESDSLTGTGNPGYRKFAPLPHENHTFLRNVTKRKPGRHFHGKGLHPPGDPRNPLKSVLVSQRPLWAPQWPKKAPKWAQWVQKGPKRSPKAHF